MSKQSWFGALFAPRGGPKPPSPSRADIPKWFSVRVAQCEAAAEGIRVFDLVAMDASPLPAFTAGAHIDVQMNNGLVRQYSLCNAPSERHRYRIAVLREPQSRGGSAYMHDAVQPGDVLKVSSPKNHFGLDGTAASFRLVAGGIGITPILAMAQSLTERGASFNLIYAGRTRSRMAFIKEITRSDFAGSARIHVDDEAGAPLDLIRALAAPKDGEHLYVCGPGALIEATLETAAVLGWADQMTHREHFSNQSVPAEMKPFDLKLIRSGRTVHVPADKTALQVLREAGIDVEASCEEGVCGTCVTRVISGKIEHRDVYLTPNERLDRFTPCCSRGAGGVLVLDL